MSDNRLDHEASNHNINSQPKRQSHLDIAEGIPVANSNGKTDVVTHEESANPSAVSALDIAKKLKAECHFSSHLGIEIVEARDNYSVCKMLVQACHTNGHKNCHGGAIFSLADTTFGHLCNAHNTVTVGHICTIAYWRPASLGDELYAYAYESGLYGRSGSYRVEITRGENGEVVAEFQGFSRSLKGQSHF